VEKTEACVFGEVRLHQLPVFRSPQPLPTADGECHQTIVHPAISVWTVSGMPNGDIVTGASDGVVRIFSEAEERWASPEDLKAFDELVASQALPAQQVGDIKKSDLPGPEALGEPGMHTFTRAPASQSHSCIGRKPGEVKMIQNGSITEAHQVRSIAAFRACT
jgi:phospholipase A-2-activating protein